MVEHAAEAENKSLCLHWRSFGAAALSCLGRRCVGPVAVRCELDPWV